MARGQSASSGRAARSELGTVLGAKFANDRSLEAKIISDGDEDFKRAGEMAAGLDKIAEDASRYDRNYVNGAYDDVSNAHNALTDFIEKNLDPEKVKNDPTFSKQTPKQISESNGFDSSLLKEEMQDKYDELVDEENRARRYAERVQDEMENPAIDWKEAWSDLQTEIKEFQDYSSLTTFYGSASGGSKPYTKSIESIANKMIQYGRRHGETAGEISSESIRDSLLEVQEASKEIGRLRADMAQMSDNDEKDEVKIAGTYGRHQEATRRFIDNATNIVRIAIEQRDLYNGLRRYDNRSTRGDED